MGFRRSVMVYLVSRYMKIPGTDSESVLDQNPETVVTSCLDPPAGCLTVHAWHCFPEVQSAPAIEGLSPQGCPHFRCQLQAGGPWVLGLPMLVRLGSKLGVPLPRRF